MVNKKDQFIQQKWGLDEDERTVIYQWSRARHEKMQKFRKKYYYKFLLHTFNFDTLKSFIKNFNFMVILQMLIAALSVYVFEYFDISFDFHVSLFVSPIVFPLAFSINTDFQRREKVLEDLANYKAAAMLWFFCMREWKTASNLTDEWLNAVHLKVKNMMFNLREYLLTEKLERRRFIARCLYEDFSDANQLIEQVRASELPANTSIISRVIHLLNMLCLSFERLRVIREYRSPRSIRSFNKVLILFLPIILSPYFVYLSKKENSNPWSPYYIAVLVAAVFGALQGVQDKLDDPFDGMSEDDIKLQTIDEWTFNSFEVVKNRNFTVGRFHVSANIDSAKKNVDKTEPMQASVSTSKIDGNTNIGFLGSRLFKKSMRRKKRANSVIVRRSSTSGYKHRQSVVDPQNHPYADVLQNIKGNTRVQAVKGKVKVTDLVTLTDLEKMKSNSSLESNPSTPSENGNRLSQIFGSTEHLDQSETTASMSISDASDCDSRDNDEIVEDDNLLTVHQHGESAQLDVENITEQNIPTEQLETNSCYVDIENNFDSPTKEPLIHQTPSKSRFKLNAVKTIIPNGNGNSSTPDIIKNNNTNDSIPKIQINGEIPKCNGLITNEHELEEIVISNPSSVTNDKVKESTVI